MAQFINCMFACILTIVGSASAADVPAVPQRKRVVVIPAREEVNRPLHYIIRRGLKEAIEQKADLVVLDMKTPGGALDVTFDIMEALAKFPGETITYVNSEALSAGAFIAATTGEIWFAPNGVIGAAAPVLSTGGEIDATMRLKIVSYLKARIRSTSEGRGYRGQVISAMIDSDFELKIGDRVLKPKGELLSLTAKEASETFGEAHDPLLAAGIAKSVDELLTAKFGKDGYTTKVLEVTWSENLAVWLNAISPILIGLGMLSLYIEFKTPGFGVFGVVGIVLLAVYFLSNFAAGLSGHEPMLLFAVGLLMVAVEIFFFPGVAVMAVTGLAIMVGALVWSMSDLWPNEPFTFSGGWLVQPLTSVGLGLALSVVLALALVRFLPRGWMWDRMILHEAVGVGGTVATRNDNLVGQRGVAATALRPSGQVEIGGQRHEAKVEVGTIEVGTPIIVEQRSSFGLIVKKDQP